MLYFSNSQANNLPDLGSPDLVEYDKQTEQQLGRAFNTALHTQYQLFNDLETNAYIRELGHKLASFTGDNRNYRFYIINDSSINAFAGPDGIIGIHTGLIEATETEDELAAVIAHEISHVTQNHLSRRYEYSATNGNINSIASVIAAILIGMYDPSAGMATLMGGMGYNLQQQLKNSRMHESEADSIGIELLYKAGYNPHAMGDFFGRLSKASQLDTFKAPEILRTHPVSEHRLAEAENRAQNLGKQNHLKPESYLNFIKMRLRALESTQAPFDSKTTSSADKEACYNQALKLIESGKTVAKCLAEYANKTENLPVFTTALVESYTKNDTDLSAEKLEKLNKLIEFKLELHPNNPSIPLRYSRLLAKLGKTQQGIDLLEKAEKNLKYRYELYNELAELYSKKQKESYVYIYLAKANFEIGNIDRSEYFLKRSKETLNKNSNKLKQEIFIFEDKISKLLKNNDKKENN
ncbi:putative beta-barrel assembly-enhancing protease [Thiomicrorhabdus immobilis]|uniref:Beta-barrel assembly-enhancing protease n=2 Tax=Thiomicrorhabdus immobilis TaxID=2791037 RepID=A0ABM7MEI9_9GAMM|nr:putative beta-barrel assembly-enhancing protease [Thiomicrorhabdus immobilis]